MSIPLPNTYPRQTRQVGGEWREQTTQASALIKKPHGIRLTPRLLYLPTAHAFDSMRPPIMTQVRAFLARVTVEPWDGDAAEQDAQIRATAKIQGRSAGDFDIMIAAHARALGAALVSSDAAIGDSGVVGLQVVEWR